MKDFFNYLPSKSFYLPMFWITTLGSLFFGLVFQSIEYGMFYFIFWTLLSPIVYALEAKTNEEEQKQTSTSSTNQGVKLEQKRTEGESSTITTKVRW